MGEDCPVCRDSSEMVYRLKQAELGIKQHEEDVKEELEEVEARCMEAIKEVKQDLQWFRNSAWMILCGGLLAFVSVVIERVM